MANEIGRPIRSEEDKNDVFRKIEPYLKMGLSINKSAIEAGVSKSLVYEIRSEDPIFAERIEKAMQHTSVLISSSIVNHLYSIMRKQNPRDGESKIPLTRDDLDFIKWYSLNSRTTKEEFGERKEVDVIDPEGEIKKIKTILEEGTNGKKFSDDIEPLTE